MKKITKTFEVYEYDELDENIKNKLLEEKTTKIFESWCESELYNFMKDKAIDLLKNYFPDSTFNKVYYDLGYCQGDGAQVNFTIDVLTLNKKYNFFSKKVTDFLKNGANYEINVRQDGYYYHEKAFEIDWYDIDAFAYYENYLSFEELDNANSQLDRMIDLFKEDITKMNIDLKKYGYKLIEDEEYFKSIALDELNTYSYLKNGDIFDEVRGC